MDDPDYNNKDAVRRYYAIRCAKYYNRKAGLPKKFNFDDMTLQDIGRHIMQTTRKLGIKHFIKQKR